MTAVVAQTGRFGLIGAAVHAMLAERYAVRSIDIHPAADLVVDLSEPERIASLDLSGCEALVHCAGIVDEDFTNTGRAFRQATQGMAALVARAKACGVKRFVYISSAHVYGPFLGRKTEASPPNPLSDYAIAHFASEQILRRAAGPEFSAQVVRPCAVFGIPPDLARFRRWALIPFGFPKSLVTDGVVTLKSSGLQHRNFVATADIAHTIGGWLERPVAAPFTLANPVGKTSMTVYDFARMCADIATRVTGRPCGVVRPEGAVGGPDDFDYTTDDARNVGDTDLAGTVERLTVLLQEGRA